MAKRYTISDGKLVLTLEEYAGVYTVTSPIDPGLVTQAKDVSEAFSNARDAMKALATSRAKRAKELRRSRTG